MKHVTCSPSKRTFTLAPLDPLTMISPIYILWEHVKKLGLNLISTKHSTTLVKHYN
jgi:hypothetical protein